MKRAAKNISNAASEGGDESSTTAAAQQLQKYALMWVPVLLKAAGEINLRIKYMAERTMYLLLEGGSTTALNAFGAKTDAALGAQVRDYCKKYLSRLSADSEGEGGGGGW